jgi:hypothetical protein
VNRVKVRARDAEVQDMTDPKPPRFDATRASGAMKVEACDIPDGMTIREWRSFSADERRKAAKRERMTLRARLLLRARRAG